MPNQPMVTGARYMVVAGHYLATQAGFAILEAGGNAIDAGVTAGMALGVVHSDQVQFSGVAPIMIYLAEREEVITISGLGTWPKATSLDYFVKQHGGTIPLGLRRTVVPAAPDAWILALEKFGTMSFAEVASAAIRYARDGFTMHPHMASFLETYEANYRKWPQNKAIWLARDRPARPGELFVQSDLAASIQFMADEEAAAAAKGGREAGLQAARAAFYTGDLAAQMVAYHRDNEGWLTAEDMAGYRSAIEAPERVRFGDTDVYSCGPWCQGPVLLQMLSLLRDSDVAELGHNSADYIHVITEAMKLAFADRERFYGDPRFVDVPMEKLLSEAYAAERRKLIRRESAWPEMPPPGDLKGGGILSPSVAASGATALSADTSYACVVDADGNAFSGTPSDVSFESPVIPGLGFCPSARGAQSFAVPGHASAIAPGKRPRLTPNPAMAIQKGKRVMPFGTPGGDVQCQGMLQVFLNIHHFGMSVQDAVEAPRFATHSFPNSFEPHDYFPRRLDVEGRIDTATTDALTARGHEVDRLADFSPKAAGICIIDADQETGILSGGADPRRPARAMGW